MGSKPLLTYKLIFPLKSYQQEKRSHFWPMSSDQQCDDQPINSDVETLHFSQIRCPPISCSNCHPWKFGHHSDDQLIVTQWETAAKLSDSDPKITHEILDSTLISKTNYGKVRVYAAPHHNLRFRSMNEIQDGFYFMLELKLNLAIGKMLPNHQIQMQRSLVKF